MQKNKMLSRIISFCLVCTMLLATPMNVRADIVGDTIESETPLREGDGVFHVDVYSAYKGKYEGTFFKKDNTLYVSKETILGMADFDAGMDAKGNLVRVLREVENGAIYEVADYDTYTFDGVLYYPFVEAMTDLCINVIFDRENQNVRAIPAKNAYGLVENMNKMLNNGTYRMSEWRTNLYLNAEDSRFTAKVTDIGRHMFSLPSTIYSYASGDADYEMYRTALWDICMPKVGVELNKLDNFWEEKTFLDTLQVGADLAEKFPTDKMFFGFTNEESQLMGKAAGVINDAGKIVQYQDSMEVISFYYNVDNINTSVANGIRLMSYVGLDNDLVFSSAVNDVVKFNQGDTNLSAMLMEEMGDGLVDIAFGKLNYGLDATIGEFAVGMMDYIGEAVYGEDYVTKQLDAILKSTTNLRIQDSAEKAYKHYRSIYKSAVGYEKQYTALHNMKDTMLVYMLAGHNAWKAMEFDKDLATSSKANVTEMQEYIAYLLGFGEEDFCVYQNAYSTGRSLLSVCEGRQQSICFVKWDPLAASQVGGVDISIIGTDKDGYPLQHTYYMAHIFSQRNGMYVGRINQQSKNSASKTITYYETEFPCELVIRPGDREQHARGVTNEKVENLGISISVGYPGNLWSGDLSRYLVTEADGNTAYRIPLPLEGSTSGESAVSGTEDDNQEGTTEEDINIFEKYGYTPEGPFDGELFWETDEYTFRLRVNTKTIIPDYFSGQLAVVYPEDIEQMYNEHFAIFNFENTDVETYYQDKIEIAERRKGTVSATDLEEMELGWGTLYYFTVQVTGEDEISWYYYIIDYGKNNCVVGSWYPNRLTEKGKHNFTQLMLELFGNVTITDN